MDLVSEEMAALRGAPLPSRSSPRSRDRAPPRATPAADAAHAGAAFGVDLYRLFAAREGNIFFSPYSISEALALLSAGAGGKTRQELLDTLHWTLPSDQMAAAFGAQDRQLAGAAGDGAVLSVANGLWYQRGHEPLAAFLQAARQSYGAEVRIADFSADLPVSRHMINTGSGKEDRREDHRFAAGRRPDAAHSSGAGQRSLLQGLLAERPFDAQRTAPRRSSPRPGESVGRFHDGPDRAIQDASADGCDLLELPYAGGELSMVILLPRTRDGLPDLEQHLSAAGLSLWLAALDKAAPAELEVALPRFKMSYSAELTGPLQRLGMATPFAEGIADFSGINGRRDLYVSAVVHRAFVDVNEEGTEAAAATGIVVTSLAVQVARYFTVDHPFLFLIRDASTGSILFLGRIVDPQVM